MTQEEQLSQQEKEALKEYLGLGASMPEDKHNVHSFLHKVSVSKDTTKTGNLTIEELGMPKMSLRGLKNAALIAEHIVGNTGMSDYLNAKAESLTATSLSKDAKLLTLAVVQKRVIEDTTKPKKENSGWFKPKDKQAPEENSI